MYTIKNLGKEISDVIVEDRKKNKSFKSFADFLSRITHRNLNHKSLESLIKAGALDNLGEARGTLLSNIDLALTFNKEVGRNGNANQDSIFGIMEDSSSIPELTLNKQSSEVNKKDILAWERELLGLYVSGHPLDDFRDKFTKKENTISYSKKLSNGVDTMIGGIIEEVKVINTKKGDRMAFVKISDFTDSMEMVIFSDTYEKYKDILLVEKCLATKGNVSHRNGEVSLIAKAFKEFKNLK